MKTISRGAVVWSVIAVSLLGGTPSSGQGGEGLPQIETPAEASAVLNAVLRPPAPATAPTPGGDAWDGVSVDLSTGLFVHRQKDLHLHDVVPLALTRTYRPGDSGSRPFGIGSSHPYDLFLVAGSQFVDLVLPDGSAIRYTQTAPGAPAAFEHTATPTAFYKSTITPGLFATLALELTDGTGYGFGLNPPLHGMWDMFLKTVAVARVDDEFLSPGAGDITRITSPAGRFIEFTYDAVHRITRARDNLDRSVLYAYDASGRLASVTDPEGGVTRYTYDGSHRMLTVEDGRGIVHLTNEYDAAGRVRRQIQADQTTYTFAYTLGGNGRVTRTDVTDPRGVVRRVTFDAKGYALSDTRALGTPVEQTTTYERDSAGLVLAMTDALGRRTAFTYDDRGHVTSVTRLAGGAETTTTTLTYAATGSLGTTIRQLASITDPLGHTTSFSYADRTNPSAVTDPLGNRTSVAVSEGLLIEIGDPLGHTTSVSYDVPRNVTGVTDPLGQLTAGSYDAVGRLTSRTDPRGRTTAFAYDRLDRLTRVIDAAGGATAFQYDPNGNLAAVTDALGGVTRYTYDGMDRLASRTDPLQRSETYAYDGNGNLTAIADRKGQLTTLAYDALNRPTAVTYADGSGTAYTWDAGNRLVRAVDSLSGIVARAYDGHDRLTSESTPSGAVAYTYDAAGRRTAMTVDREPAVGYGYDAAGRLTRVSRGSAVADLSYDGAGRRTRLDLPSGIAVEYAYDGASRLTRLTYRFRGAVLGTLTYAYDAGGHRVRVGGTWARTAMPHAVASADHDDANQLLAFGSRTLTHDLNGNLTSDGVHVYTWNVRNQLVSVDGPAVTASFAYDALGRREGKQVDGVFTSFVHDGVSPVQENGPISTVSLLEGPGIDEHLAREEGGERLVFLSDGLGSILALADETGAFRTLYTYAPFGAAVATGVSDPNVFQFTGRENDGVAGLQFNRARYYHPILQRFLSEDPVGFAGGNINLYAYARNNPVSLTDPLGLDAQIAMYPSRIATSGAGLSAMATSSVYRLATQPAAPLAFRLPAISDAAAIGRMMRMSTSPEQERAMQEVINLQGRLPCHGNRHARSCRAPATSPACAGGIPSAWVPEETAPACPGAAVGRAPQPVPWSWMDLSAPSQPPYTMRAR